MQLLPIILSGGSGTRLWPVSREAMPKPFMKIAGGKSLLQLTWERAWALPGVSHAAVVTNMAYSYKTAEELMDETGAKQISLLLEPVGRNTAPAVALAALWAEAKFGPDVVFVVLAADHLIDSKPVSMMLWSTPPRWLSAKAGWCFSASNRRGRKPDMATSNGGRESRLRMRTRSCALSKSRRSSKAAEYLRAGNFVWNSGMFCFTAAAILDALEQHAPKVLRAAQARRAVQRDHVRAGQVLFDAASFGQLPDISIDYAVMEKRGKRRRDSMRFRLERYRQLESGRRRRETDEDGNAPKATRYWSTRKRTIFGRKIDWWRPWASKTWWSSIRPMRYWSLIRTRASK